MSGFSILGLGSPFCRMGPPSLLFSPLSQLKGLGLYFGSSSVVLGIDPLGLGGRQTAKMLKREATWSRGPVQARSPSQVTASTYTAVAMGGGIAATEVILGLILIILVVMRRQCL